MKKRAFSGILAWAMLLALCLTACGGTGDGAPNTADPGGTPTPTADIPDGGEDGGDDAEPAGTDSAFTDMSGMTVREAVEAYGFYVTDADGSGSYTAGDTVCFGSYPQAMVTEEGTLAALAEKAGVLPTASSAGDWTSYRWYDGGEEADYAFYRDVTVDGERYRGVYLLDYRPYYAKLAAGADGSYMDDNGLALGTVYWYRYDPIVWTVLTFDGTDGTVLLASQYSLDAQPFQALYEYTEDGEVVIPGTETPINDWEASTVRSFLNGDFLSLAFSDYERTLIRRVTVDNRTTGFAADAPYQQGQNDTDDKVFLLSCAEVQNRDYGYSSKGASRIRSYTDYAASQGLRSSSQSSSADGEAAAGYLLRSAGAQSNYTAIVNKMGSVSGDPNSSNNVEVNEATAESVDGLTYNGDMGVLPALRLRVTPDGEDAKGEWVYSTYDYTDSTGAAAQLSYGVYVPAAYEPGDALPLITYIPDASYVGKSADKVAKAQGPVNWTTEDKMREHPCFFLIFSFAESSSDVRTEGSEGAQIVPIIRRVAEEYGIDADRLYLTGQSMGGITDFALNDAYPEMFAATVYVGCQPGGDVGDEMYNSILANKEFLRQKFIYIASRMDEKAPYGQDDVEAALTEAGIEYGKRYDLDHKGGDSLEAAVWETLSQGYEQNLLGFVRLTDSGDGVAEHMQSFKYSYAVDALFDWLLDQHR